MDYTSYCPICKKSLENDPFQREAGEDANHYTCMTCGNFVLSGTIGSNVKILNQVDASILSGFIANATRDAIYASQDDIAIIPVSGKEVDVHSGNLEQIIANAPVPSNPEEMMDRLLYWISRACWRVNYQYQFHSLFHLSSQ